MKTYNKAEKLLNKRNLRKLAGHTWIQKDGGAISVKFWNTEIVRVFLNGDVAVFNGGYETVTTKQRINWILSELGIKWGVFQKNHQWFWSKYLGNGKHSNPRPFVYHNTFNQNGKMLSV